MGVTLLVTYQNIYSFPTESICFVNKEIDFNTVLKSISLLGLFKVF